MTMNNGTEKGEGMGPSAEAAPGREDAPGGAVADRRLRLVLGEALALRTTLLMVHSGKRYRVLEVNRETLEHVLEPVEMEIMLKPLTHKDADLNYFQPAPSKYLPGNPQPWKRRGRR